MFKLISLLEPERAAALETDASSLESFTTHYITPPACFKPRPLDADIRTFLSDRFPERLSPSKTLISIDLASTLAGFDRNGNLVIPPKNLEVLCQVIKKGFTVVINTSETHSTVISTLLWKFTQDQCQRLEGSIFHILPLCGAQHYQISFWGGRYYEQALVTPTQRRYSYSDPTPDWPETSCQEFQDLAKKAGYESIKFNQRDGFQEFRKGIDKSQKSAVLAWNTDWLYARHYGEEDTLLSDFLAHLKPKHGSFPQLKLKANKEVFSYNDRIVFSTTSSKKTGIASFAKRIAGINRGARDFINGIQNFIWLGDHVNDASLTNVDESIFPSLLTTSGFFFGEGAMFELLNAAHHTTLPLHDSEHIGCGEVLKHLAEF